jgi:hypothetical protein
LECRDVRTRDWKGKKRHRGGSLNGGESTTPQRLFRIVGELAPQRDRR